jgi:sugar/nucleoside kinase (ribokinase family)
VALDVVTLGIACADVVVRPVDALPKRGTLAIVPELEIHLGGLAAVTATVLCQLGAKAAFVGAVGRDGFGDYILRTLESEGVDVRGVLRRDGLGSSATVVLVDGTGERTFLHHLGTNATVTDADVDMEFVGQARVLHWGGPAVTPGLDGAPAGRILERARAAGLKTSVDTVFDARGVWLPHIEPSLRHLDIVMSSIKEAQKYTGRQEPEEIADFYLGYGAEVAVIKLGKDGIFAKSESESVCLPGHRVDVIDTTGAGDAACGGFLYGYLQGWELERSVRLANAVGGLTVQAMGGAEAIESLDQVLAFMEGHG